MIGYILLITSAVVMGALVYQWLKTYVPQDQIICSDGVSMQVQESLCTEDATKQNVYYLNLVLKNNGRFSTGGYFLKATNETFPELAVIDLSKDFKLGQSIVIDNAMVQKYYDNGIYPGREITDNFNFTGEITSLEIVPIQFKEFDRKKRLVSCSNARIFDNLECIDCSKDELCETDSCGKPLPDGCPTIECDPCDEAGEGEICILNECTFCGNGDVDEGEECDLGRFCRDDKDKPCVSDSQCDSACITIYKEGCDSFCQCDNTEGYIDDPDSKGCILDMRGNPEDCGNGVLDDGETCDDGDEIDDNCCSNDCSTFRTGCTQTPLTDCTCN